MSPCRPLGNDDTCIYRADHTITLTYNNVHNGNEDIHQLYTLIHHFNELMKVAVQMTM